MSASLRFLALAVVGWTAVRAATLGALPGTAAFTLGRAQAPPRAATAPVVPAIVPTEFPAIEPAGTELLPSAVAEPLPAGPIPIAIPTYYYPVSTPGGARFVPASLPAPPARPAHANLPRAGRGFFTRRSRNSMSGHCRAWPRRRCRHGALRQPLRNKVHRRRR